MAHRVTPALDRVSRLVAAAGRTPSANPAPSGGCWRENEVAARTASDEKRNGLFGARRMTDRSFHRASPSIGGSGARVNCRVLPHGRIRAPFAGHPGGHRQRGGRECTGWGRRHERVRDAIYSAARARHVPGLIGAAYRALTGRSPWLSCGTPLRRHVRMHAEPTSIGFAHKHDGRTARPIETCPIGSPSR